MTLCHSARITDGQTDGRTQSDLSSRT